MTEKIGWMVQYQDEYGRWHDYKWTEDPKEERATVRNLNRLGNTTRTIITQEPQEIE